MEDRVIEFDNRLERTAARVARNRDGSTRDREELNKLISEEAERLYLAVIRKSERAKKAG
jgi:hypothetical protein